MNILFKPKQTSPAVHTMRTARIGIIGIILGAYATATIGNLTVSSTWWDVLTPWFLGVFFGALSTGLLGLINRSPVDEHRERVAEQKRINGGEINDT